MAATWQAEADNVPGLEKKDGQKGEQRKLKEQEEGDNSHLLSQPEWLCMLSGRM